MTFGKFGNLGVRLVLLATKFTTGKTQNDKLVATPPLVEFLKLSVLTAGCASFGCHIGCVDDLASKFFHGQGGTIALEG